MNLRNTGWKKPVSKGCDWVILLRTFLKRQSYSYGEQIGGYQQPWGDVSERGNKKGVAQESFRVWYPDCDKSYINVYMQ
jgi:hypothetical protein